MLSLDTKGNVIQKFVQKFCPEFLYSFFGQSPSPQEKGAVLTLVYEENGLTLHQDDCLNVLEAMAAEGQQCDMIFADPPYNLSNGGMSCHAGKRVSVNKGEWDRSNGLAQDLQFTARWIDACRAVLKENGTIWISGTLHNIYMTGYVLQELKFHILNDIAWFKSNAPPHLACRYFAHSHETVLWARKSKKARHYFDYPLMKKWDDERDTINKADKQMRSVWCIPVTPQKEKVFGKHPTQKPEELLKRVILSSTKKGALVLDPFCGSGTTGVVAKVHGRRFIGIDQSDEFLKLAQKRIENTTPQDKKQKSQPVLEFNAVEKSRKGVPPIIPQRRVAMG